MILTPDAGGRRSATSNLPQSTQPRLPSTAHLPTSQLSSPKASTPFTLTDWGSRLGVCIHTHAPLTQSRPRQRLSGPGGLLRSAIRHDLHQFEALFNDCKTPGVEGGVTDVIVPGEALHVWRVNVTRRNPQPHPVA